MASTVIQRLRLLQPSCSALLHINVDRQKTPNFRQKQSCIQRTDFRQKKGNDYDNKSYGSWRLAKYGVLAAAFVQMADDGPNLTFESWSSEEPLPPPPVPAPAPPVVEIPVGIAVPAVGPLQAHYEANGIFHFHQPAAIDIAPPDPEQHDDEVVDIGPPINVADHIAQLHGVVGQLQPAALAQLLATALNLANEPGNVIVDNHVVDDVSDGHQSVGDLDVEELDELMDVNDDQHVDEPALQIEEPIDDDNWDFGFELDFVRSTGNLALMPLAEGRCHRFRKVNNVEAIRDGFHIVRCRNCRQEYDKAVKRGDLNPGSVRSWRYMPINQQNNQYRFVDSPYLNHNHHCLANPVNYGIHAAEWLVGRALMEFQVNPFGTAFSAWNRVFVSAPRLIWERFGERVNTRDWVRALKSWHTTKTRWYDARAAVNPPFDWNNIHDCYRLTNMGQVPNEMMGERFIRYCNPATKFMVMCSPSGARALYNSRVWSVDGTFKCIRKIDGVRQLFVMNGLHPTKNEYRTLAMGTLPAQDERSYRMFFDVVKYCIRQEVGVEEGHEADNVTFMMSDWEKPITLAARHCFPGMVKKFCCFHYGQSIIRAVKRYHLLNAYQGGDPHVRSYVHALLGTMMIPQQYMERWANTMRHAPVHANPVVNNDLQAFADAMYLEYLSTADKRQRLDAFSTTANNPRTSNSLEGWNNGIYKSMRLANATMSTLMSGLVQLDYAAFCREVKLNDDQATKRRRTKYVQLDARIQAQKEMILPLLAQMEGAVLDERLHRWARYCARMLGGAVHKKMFNGLPLQVDQIPNVVNEEGEIIDVGNDMNLDNFLLFIIDDNDVPPEEDINVVPDGGHVVGDNAAGDNGDVDFDANAAMQQQFEHQQQQQQMPQQVPFWDVDGQGEAEVHSDSEDDDVNGFWEGWGGDEDW